ncbi:MAG: hypothetical protein ABL973_02980 [Micropepsaceae bacterium]
MANYRDDIDEADDEPVFVGRAIVVGAAAGITAFLLFVAQSQMVRGNYHSNSWSEQASYEPSYAEPSPDRYSAPPATNSDPEKRQYQDQPSQEQPQQDQPQQEQPSQAQPRPDESGALENHNPYPAGPTSR